MFTFIKNIVLIVIFCFAILGDVFAQNTQIKFDKNRVQYKEFNWNYVSTDNFEIYFSEGGYPIAQLAAKYAELEYDRIVDLVDFAPYSKIKIIIYNSHTDLLQSNIKTQEENPALGGQTEFIKSKIEIPFEGNQIEFKQRISAGITNFLITDMMYGGSLRDIYRNSLFLTLPDWYIPGLAAYIAKGNSQDMDDYLRDEFSFKKVNSPSQISPSNPTLVGQSVWHYTTLKSGKNAIAQILSLTRITRNYETAFSHTIGLKYSKFEKEWRNHFKLNADATIEAYTIPDTKQAFRKNSKNYNYFRIKHSPNGQFVAFSENYKGKYKVWVLDTQTGKKKQFLKGGQKSIDQEINYNIPLLAWKSDKVLSVIEIKKDKVHMTTEDVNGGPRTTRLFGSFDQVLDFDYSDDGNNIVFSAEKNGQSDIYLFAIRSNTMKQVTNDLFDDEHPVFFKGKYSFVFSSNRFDDTLVTRQLALSQLVDNSDIFVYAPLVSTTKLNRLTSTAYNEIFPVPLADNSIAYLQNESGVFNLTVLKNDYKISNQVTDLQQDIQHFDISYSGKYSFVTRHKNRELFFPNYKIDFTKSFKPTVTPRKQSLIDKENVGKITLNIEPTKTEIISNEPLTNTKVSDTIVVQKQVEIDPNSDEFTFSSSQKPSIEPSGNINTPVIEKEVSIDEQLIDYNNYVFETEKSKGNQTEQIITEPLHPNPIISQGIKTERTIKISDYKPLKNKLSINNVLESIYRDNLRGYGVVVESSVSDMLENHKFEGNVFASFNLRTSTMSLSYEYLKKRFDYKFKYEKQRIIANDTSSAEHKLGMDRFEGTISYPFSPSAKIMFTAFGYSSKTIDLYSNSSLNDRYNLYTGGRLEYVFNNTIQYGMNMQTGTKIHFVSEHNIGTIESKSSFNRIQIDIRKYAPLHKEIVLATRLSAGSFYGKSPKNYLLGGVDNWFFPKGNNLEGDNNPLYVSEKTDNRDWFFNQYATNLRGYQFNSLYGNSHILANVELRIPISKYLYNGVIASNFVRNLQFLGFYDVGTAWSNSNPLNVENSFNTTYVSTGSGALSAKVINFKNPFLSSFGLGVRSFAMGYYVKFDVALPVIDYVVQKPTAMLSLGYDF